MTISTSNTLGSALREDRAILDLRSWPSICFSMIAGYSPAEEALPLQIPPASSYVPRFGELRRQTEAPSLLSSAMCVDHDHGLALLPNSHQSPRRMVPDLDSHLCELQVRRSHDDAQAERKNSEGSQDLIRQEKGLDALTGFGVTIYLFPPLY